MDPAQTVAFPVMPPGVTGVGVTVTGRVAAAELPQELFAVTVMFPLVAPAVRVILLVVLVPVQPRGAVQV